MGDPSEQTDGDIVSEQCAALAYAGVCAPMASLPGAASRLHSRGRCDYEHCRVLVLRKGQNDGRLGTSRAAMAGSDAHPQNEGRTLNVNVICHVCSSDAS